MNLFFKVMMIQMENLIFKNKSVSSTQNVVIANKLEYHNPKSL